MASKKQEESSNSGEILGNVDTIFMLFFCVGMIIATIILIQYANGVFDSPIDELEIDKDLLVEKYILSYYPEFEGCAMEYKYSSEIECNLDIDGAEVYCGSPGKRDGMSIGKNNPTETICFDDVSLEEILNEYILEIWR